MELWGYLKELEGPPPYPPLTLKENEPLSSHLKTLNDILQDAEVEFTAMGNPAIFVWFWKYTEDAMKELTSRVLATDKFSADALRDLYADFKTAMEDLVDYGEYERPPEKTVNLNRHRTALTRLEIEIRAWENTGGATDAANKSTAKETGGGRKSMEDFAIDQFITDLYRNDFTSRPDDEKPKSWCVPNDVKAETGSCKHFYFWAKKKGRIPNEFSDADDLRNAIDRNAKDKKRRPEVFTAPQFLEALDAVWNEFEKKPIRRGRNSTEVG